MVTPCSWYARDLEGITTRSAFNHQPLASVCSKYPMLNDQVGEWEGEKSKWRLTVKISITLWQEHLAQHRQMGSLRLIRLLRACLYQCALRERLHLQTGSCDQTCAWDAHGKAGDCSTRASGPGSLCKFTPSRRVICLLLITPPSLPHLSSFSPSTTPFSPLRKYKTSAKATKLQFCLDRLQRIMYTCLPFIFPLVLHGVIPTLEHSD